MTRRSAPSTTASGTSVPAPGPAARAGLISAAARPPAASTWTPKTSPRCSAIAGSPATPATSSAAAGGGSGGGRGGAGARGRARRGVRAGGGGGGGPGGRWGGGATGGGDVSLVIREGAPNPGGAGGGNFLKVSARLHPQSPRSGPP